MSMAPPPISLHYSEQQRSAYCLISERTPASTTSADSTSFGFARGVDHGGCRRGQSMFCPPIKCRNNSFIQNLLYNCKFHSINLQQLDTITSLILLMLRCFHLNVWSAPSSVFQSIPLLLGLELSRPKTKFQNVGAPTVGHPHRTVDSPHRWCTSWRSGGVRLPWQ